MEAEKDLLFREECFDIKQSCIDVRRELGNGFLEKVYENALKIALESKGYCVESQKEIDVLFQKQVVGKYFCDLLVNNKIIIEMKCAVKITAFHKAQLLNYLVATGYRLGLIINFPGDRTGFDIERVVN